MPTLTIRRATPADAETVVEFNRLLAEESEGKTLDRSLLEPGVAKALSDPNKGLYFLAEDGGKIVGQTMVTFEWSDWRNGWFWWIQSVYVAPDARGRGVYRALHESVLAEARADGGVCGVRLYVEHENRAAQATYAAVGMRPARYVVYEDDFTAS